MQRSTLVSLSCAASHSADAKSEYQHQHHARSDEDRRRGGANSPNRLFLLFDNRADFAIITTVVAAAAALFVLVLILRSRHRRLQGRRKCRGTPCRLRHHRPDRRWIHHGFFESGVGCAQCIREVVRYQHIRDVARERIAIVVVRRCKRRRYLERHIPSHGLMQLPPRPSSRASRLAPEVVD